MEKSSGTFETQEFPLRRKSKITILYDIKNFYYIEPNHFHFELIIYERLKQLQ